VAFPLGLVAFCADAAGVTTNTMADATIAKPNAEREIAMRTLFFFWICFPFDLTLPLLWDYDFKGLSKKDDSGGMSADAYELLLTTIDNQSFFHQY
jgi:hypothetical protein